MSEALERLYDALGELALAAHALPPALSLAELKDIVRESADMRDPSTRGALAAGLRRSMHLSLGLIAFKRLEPDFLPFLTRAYGAFLAVERAPSELSARRGAPTPVAPFLLALDGAPRARVVDRELLALDEPAAGVPDEEEDVADDYEPSAEEVAEIEAAANAKTTLDPPPPELIRVPVPPPPVRIVRDAARVATLPEVYAEVVERCAETMGVLARDRSEAPWGTVDSTERRMLAQLDAIVAAGPRALANLFAWWHGDLEDPWRGWVGAFGAAAFAGGDALEGVAQTVGVLPPNSLAHAALVAEALHVSSHAELSILCRELTRAPSAVARAIGVAVLSARRELTPDELTIALNDASLPVLRAGIAACETCPPAARAALVPLLRTRMRGPYTDAAWSAARVLTLWGERDPYLDLTAGKLDEALGPFSAEMFVLKGRGDDLARLQTFLSRYPVNAARLSTIARFGCPTVWAFLVHHLADEEMGEGAARALETLFGPLVPAEKRMKGAAWRGAIAARKFDRDVRYRRGLPWSPLVVADELESGELSRREIALRVDELRVRAHVQAEAPSNAWFPTADGELRAFVAAVRKQGRDFSPGKY